MQFPNTDIPGDNLAIHPINEEDGYDLTSVPSSYGIVPQVYHGKKPIHPQVLAFQGTLDGLAEVFKQALIEEYRCLEIVLDPRKLSLLYRHCLGIIPTKNAMSHLSRDTIVFCL